MAERTGISTATLRAWERRYGVPEPARSNARYRLYSERDLGKLRRMATLCEGGLRPAEAARLVRLPTPPPGCAQSITGIDDGGDRVIAAFRALAADALRAALAVANEHDDAHVARELQTTLVRLTAPAPGRRKATRRPRKSG